MLDKLVGKLSYQRRARITLAVRETNLAAQCFFRAGGFKAEKVLHDYFDDSDEDAYAFVYRVREQVGSTAVR
jgi:ribosomal-protein-alanine N-acetyltransferase